MSDNKRTIPVHKGTLKDRYGERLMFFNSQIDDVIFMSLPSVEDLKELYERIKFTYEDTAKFVLVKVTIYNGPTIWQLFYNGDPQL